MAARMASRTRLVARGGARIEVLVDGDGPPIVLLPSLGRGAEDFAPIARELARARFCVLRPQPRGIGASRGPDQSPLACADLHDHAADVAAVIADEDHGPAFVVVHGFGTRFARMLATDRRDLVRGIGLVAANVGRDPSPPDLRRAIRDSADASLSDAQRITALQKAFFAPGNDASAWLEGWHPQVLAAQRIAGDRTPREEDYAGGVAPILFLKPDHDPLAHAERAGEYRTRLGDRVTIVAIPHASHAAIAEQPGFVAAALADYARQLFAR
jgi:pimeloyl-ACP methyl ester carboxylesterase